LVSVALASKKVSYMKNGKVNIADMNNGVTYETDANDFSEDGHYKNNNRDLSNLSNDIINSPMESLGYEDDKIYL
jgi:hypothetical protein